MLKVISLFVTLTLLGTGLFAFKRSRSVPAPANSPAPAPAGGACAIPIPVGRQCNVYLRRGLSVAIIHDTGQSHSLSLGVVNELGGKLVRSDDHWLVIDGGPTEQGTQHWIPRDAVENIDVFPN